MFDVELEIDAVNAAIEAVEIRCKSVKSNFEKCITNPDLSLDLRWNLFMRAANDLKNHKGWIEHFPGSGLDDHIGYDGTLLHVERHQDVHISDIMEAIEEHIEDGSLPEGINLVAFKEYVLKGNIGSYTYDW